MSVQPPSPDRTWVVPVVLGLLGIAVMVVGALLPWFVSPSGGSNSLPPDAAPLVSAVVAALGSVATQRWPRWQLLATAVMLAAVVLAVATSEPGGICWDGIDEHGNWIGACEDDRWTSAPLIFALGATLALAGVVVAAVTRPVTRRDVVER